MDKLRQRHPFLSLGLKVAIALEHKSLSHNVYVQCPLKVAKKQVAAEYLPK